MSADDEVSVEFVIFADWVADVEKYLRASERAALYAAAQERAGCLGVLALRGDEPEDAYLAGDAPETYAEFLLNEWALFGPGGE